MNPSEEFIEKVGKKKKTEVKVAAADYDLRKFPFFLTDGDIIGVRLDDELGADLDDF